MRRRLVKIAITGLLQLLILPHKSYNICPETQSGPDMKMRPYMGFYPVANWDDSTRILLLNLSFDLGFRFLSCQVFLDSSLPRRCIFRDGHS